MDNEDKMKNNRNLMTVSNQGYFKKIDNSLNIEHENSYNDKYNNYYKLSNSPVMNIMFDNQNRSTCYNIKPQIMTNNLPSAFEFPKEIRKKKSYEDNLRENKLLIIKEFKSSSDLSELRKKYGGPANFYNHIFENLKTKLQLHLEKDNSIEKIKNLDKVKTKKVVLKPIEIKDPRLYLPSSTNIKFDISKETQSEINKNKLKKNFHLDEIKENRFSPTNVDKNHKYNKFAKTTYVDYQKEIENERDYRLNNMSSSIPPQMNSTLIAYPKSEWKIKLEEMITIKVLKRNKNLGIIKKMIHAPSLKIYTIKEIPVINKEIRNQLKDMTEFWKKNLNSSNNMIKINDFFLNTPEGYCTLLTEYMNNGSLQNLLECTGCIPEMILKNITFQMVKILENYHKKSEIPYGGISPSQILFNKNGTLKLSINYKRIFLDNGEYKKKHIANLTKKEKTNLKYYNILMKNILSKCCNVQNKFYDLFDLGFLLLQCATGSLDIIDFNEFKCEHLDKDNNFTCCCLIHCVEKYEETLTTKLKISNFINSTYYSEEFTNFLCITTSYHNNQTLISKLKFHPLIRNFSDNKINTTSIHFKNKIKKAEKYNISLKELLKISHENGWKIDYSNLKSNTTKFDKFCENISLVLPNCESYFQNMKITDSSFLFNKKNEIQEILQEFEIDQETLHRKLKSIYDNTLSSFVLKSSN